MNVDTKKVENILNGFKNRRIITIGDAMLDEYIWGRVNRISPEAPVPVVDVQTSSLRMGGAANVAWNLKKLGAEPLLVSVVGEDDTAKKLHELLSEEKISSEYITVDFTRPTTLKTRIIAHHQQVVRVDRESKDDINEDVSREVLKKFNNSLKKADGVIISDYGKGLVTQQLVQEVVRICRENRKFVAVDPKEKHFQYYRGVSVITPNVKETENALNIRISTEKGLEEAGWEMLRQLEAENILITRGEKGMSLFQNNGEYYYLPTVAKEVFDVTGAGDTVVASFSLAATSGASFFEAAYISNHAAGIVVGEIGTAATTRNKLFEHICEEDD
ncbi:D-glycero-beta-D-manno-heptose-7-phosphate kinase [bacterium]|nr:D-glycero-beta-D-manno-heptose-7-phosphate kinase [bacterium]